MGITTAAEAEAYDHAKATRVSLLWRFSHLLFSLCLEADVRLDTARYRLETPKSLLQLRVRVSMRARTVSCTESWVRLRLGRRETVASQHHEYRRKAGVDLVS